MPDIAMCVNVKCPSRVHCYRYRAKVSGRQDYMEFIPKGSKCESYKSTSGWDDRYLTSMRELEPDGRSATISEAVGKGPKDAS